MFSYPHILRSCCQQVSDENNEKGTQETESNCTQIPIHQYDSSSLSRMSRMAGSLEQWGYIEK